MNAVKLIAEVKSGTPIFTLLKLVKGVFDDKNQADEVYLHIKPALDDFLMRGYRFNSPEIQGIVAILGELPAAGARRRNFIKYYLQDEYTLRKLPNNPNQIPYGYWH